MNVSTTLAGYPNSSHRQRAVDHLQRTVSSDLTERSVRDDLGVHALGRRSESSGRFGHEQAELVDRSEAVREPPPPSDILKRIIA